MIESGYISYKIYADNGIDENGNPIINTEQPWSELLPANIEGSKQRIYNDANANSYVKANYSIIMPTNPITDRLRLYDRNKVLLGEFAVLNTQELPILGEIKITV